MLIGDLIRLGRIVRAAMPSASKSILQVTDVAGGRAATFLQRVYVVEVDLPTNRIAVHPSTRWAETEQVGKTKRTRIDTERAAMLPFTFGAGKPSAAQGTYPVPAYPCYEKDLQMSRKDPASLERFLQLRLRRTPFLRLNADTITTLSRELSAQLQREDVEDEERALFAILPLGWGEAQTPYELLPIGFPVQNLSSKGEDEDEPVALVESLLDPGKQVVAYPSRIMDLVFHAKLMEGAEKGRLQDGTCTFCHTRGEVVSAYSKNWTWFTTTWEGPLPQELKDDEQVRSVALCHSCYIALAYGADTFGRLRRRLPDWLTHELFAPADSLSGRRIRRSQPSLLAALLALPLVDLSPSAPDALRLASALEMMAAYPPTGDPSQASSTPASPSLQSANRHLEDITGYECILPETFQTDAFTFNMIYYYGDETRGDIYLAAIIEDVSPSIVNTVQSVLKESVDDMYTYLAAKGQESNRKHEILPYILARAYGPTYVWRSLSDVLHGRPLDYSRPVRNTYHRLNERSHQLQRDADRAEMQYDILLFGIFRVFYARYSETILHQGGLATMRPWPEIQAELHKDPAAIRLQDAEELGFAVGHLLRTFSRQYFAATRDMGDEKDFLQHRVMTFGSNLTPYRVTMNGLGRVEEFAVRVRAKLSQAFRERVGVVLSEYLRRQEEVDRNADAFMVAFWAGYFLEDVSRQTLLASDEA